MRVASSFARGRSGNLGSYCSACAEGSSVLHILLLRILKRNRGCRSLQRVWLLLLFRDPADEYDYVSLFRTLRVDACIVLGASANASEREGILRLADDGMPFCVMDQRFEIPTVSVVEADHVQGSYDAVKHLIVRLPFHRFSEWFQAVFQQLGSVGGVS